MPIDGSNIHVRNNNLCINCLYSGHGTKDCRSAGRCRHVVKLTTPASTETLCLPPNPSQLQLNQQSRSNVVAVNTVALLSKPEPILLMTSQVIVEESPTGKQLMARALLDTGASISLVTSRVVQQLQLKKYCPSQELKEH